MKIKSIAILLLLGLISATSISENDGEKEQTIEGQPEQADDQDWDENPPSGEEIDTPQDEQTIASQGEDEIEFVEEEDLIEMPDTIDLSEMEELPDIDMTIDGDVEGDVVEEYDNPDGTHVKKVIHDENGVRSVRITQSGPGASIGGGPGGIMKAIMEDMMSGIANGPPPPGIRISAGPPGGAPPGMIRIGGPPPQLDDEDDDDKDGIPPEILDLIHMTEMLHMGGGFGGHIRLAKPGEKEKPVTAAERKDESMDDIMARMNRLSEEIGEQQEKKRNYDVSNNKVNQRFYQVLTIGGIIIVVMLVSFVLTCANNKKRKEVEQEIPENDVAGAFRRGFGKHD